MFYYYWEGYTQESETGYLSDPFAQWAIYTIYSHCKTRVLSVIFFRILDRKLEFYLQFFQVLSHRWTLITKRLQPFWCFRLLVFYTIWPILGKESVQLFHFLSKSAHQLIQSYRYSPHPLSEKRHVSHVLGIRKEYGAVLKLSQKWNMVLIIL